MRLFVIAAAVTLAGCATTENVWVKTGASSQDFYMDRGQCQAQAFAVPGAPMIQIAMVFNACMQGRGWWQESRPRQS